MKHGVKLVKLNRVINFKPKHSYRLCVIMQNLCVSSKFLTKLKQENNNNRNEKDIMNLKSMQEERTIYEFLSDNLL